MMGQSYREDCNEAKAARQGIVDQKPVRVAAKKDRPVIVEYRLSPDSGWPDWMHCREWRKWKSYRNVEEAERAMANMLRKHPTLWQYRLKP
jgi:hypothetical protein